MIEGTQLVLLKTPPEVNSSSGDEVDCLCVNRDSGIEIPEAWIPTIRKHNSRPTTKQTCEGTTFNSLNNNEDRNAPIAANHHATNRTRKQSTSSPDED